MRDILDVAKWVHVQLTELGFEHCVIGGIAVQHWGEPRFTRDVDLSVLTQFDNEEAKIRRLLSRFTPRIENAFEHAVRNRVLLCQSDNNVGIDMGLAGFPYEEATLSRAVNVQFYADISLPLISAEDLIVMKVFAGRPIDWMDVSTIITRQGSILDWGLVTSSLPELLDYIESPERLDQLMALKNEAS